MKDLDLTLDYMENARFNYTYGPQVNSMKALFSKTELLCLAMIYNKFTLQNQARANFLTRAQLATILELMFQVRDMDIKSRIVACISLDPECTDPKFSYEHHCTLNSFIRMFAIYFSTDLEKRIQFTFTIYDDEKRGYLDRDQVKRYVEKFFVGDDEDELLEMRGDMVDLIFSKFDLDRDLIISIDEYAEVVRKQPQILEFLGTIFPPQGQLDAVRMCVNLATE